MIIIYYYYYYYYNKAEVIRSKVINKKSLFEELKKDKRFLSEQIQQFLRIDLRKDFRKIWGNINSNNSNINNNL